MYKSIIYIFLVLSQLHSYSQSIQNVRFSQAGEKVIILYDLSDISGGVKSYSVKVFYTLDNGKTYISIKSVYGDVGNDVNPGRDKKVIWNVLNDTDELKGEIKFKVTASPKRETTILDYDLFISLRSLGHYIPYGVRIGMLGPGRIGGYVSFIYGVEYIDWDEKYIGTGGPILNIINKNKIRFSVFAGGGYYQESISAGFEEWIDYGGFVFESGFIFTYSHINFTFGLEISDDAYILAGIGFTL